MAAGSRTTSASRDSCSWAAVRAPTIGATTPGRSRTQERATASGAVPSPSAAGATGAPTRAGGGGGGRGGAEPVGGGDHGLHDAVGGGRAQVVDEARPLRGGAARALRRRRPVLARQQPAPQRRPGQHAQPQRLGGPHALPLPAAHSQALHSPWHTHARP